MGLFDRSKSEDNARDELTPPEEPDFYDDLPPDVEVENDFEAPLVEEEAGEDE
jgi:hypothetical protein